MSKKNPRNVQVLLTDAQFAWMQSFGNGSAPAGIRRLLDIVAQETSPDPLAILGALIGRAAAVHASMPRSAQPAPTPAGSTAALAAQPLSPSPATDTAPTAQQPAPADDGFEGWND